MRSETAGDSGAALVRRHRVMGFVLALVVAAELALGIFGGHRGTHALRDVLLPGAGSVDERPVVGAALIVVWLSAAVAWLRWGADWLVVLVTTVAMSLTLTLTSTHDVGAIGLLGPVRAAHEFPVVILVVAALSWLRSVVIRIPVIGPLVGGRRRRATGVVPLEQLPPVDRARAIAIAALARPEESSSLAPLLDHHDVVARARRVALIARLRTGPSALDRDHAHLHSARVLTSSGDAAAFASDAGRSPVGLPCSEPTWVRPVDAVLAALALDRNGHAAAGASLAALLDGPWRLRGRSRPAWLWTPGAVAAGAALPWEHATCTALARAAGWITTDDDWLALRPRALGAAARHRRHRDDERLIAAARIWMVLTDDPEARAVLSRPTIGDPLAQAVDRLAARLADDPDVLRRPSRHA